MLKTKLIKQYEHTIINTINVEKIFYEYYGQTQSEFKYFPRPDKWISKITPNFTFFKLFWDYIGFYLYTSFIVIYYAFKRKKGHKEKIFEKNVVLAFSHKTLPLVEQLVTYEYDIISFTDSKNKKSTSIFELYNLSDLINSYITSILFFNKLKSTKKKYTFQFYTLFSWILKRGILDKINSNFIICNHTDRWAVLTDQSQSLKNKSVILIQHGIVNLDSLKNNQYELSYKLKNVSELFVYDKISEDFFKNQILEKVPDSIVYFDPIISLTKTQFPKKFKLLFVGHPLCEELQINIFKKLKKTKDFICYYKPHPTAKASKKLRENDWIFIKDQYFFPEVNLLVSYESTLISEYLSHNIESIVHSFDNDSEISEILLKIESKHKKWQELIK